ncbi:MAG TPA: hypothetical protein VFG37_05715 [Planctomycetota bacterium]|nr:hypothetical protein [Planctomycetota bacterium]
MNGLARVLFSVVAIAASAPAQTREEKMIKEDVNPRATTTPLKVELKPYWCAICAKNGLIKDEPPPIEMMRKPVATVVEQIGLEEPPLVLFTPHFKILSTLHGSSIKIVDGTYVHSDLEKLKSILPKVQIGREGATLDAHERLHLYGVRVEREYAHFSALTGNTKPYLGMPLPYELYLFAEYAQHHAFVDRYVGGRNDKCAIEWHVQQEKGRPFGAKPTDPEVELKNFILLSVAESQVQQAQGKGDGVLSNHVFHNVAHLLVDGLDNYLRETPAWVEEGLGHYYERRESERWNNFCWAEGKPPTMFMKPDWESTVFTLVRRDRDPPFAQWCEKLQPGELSGIENGLSWSVVKWMVDTEPVRFAKMLGTMHDVTTNFTSAQELDAGFSASPSVIYQRWREYVLKNYLGK